MDALNAEPRIGLILEYNSENFFRHLDRFFGRERSILKKSWIGDINRHQREGSEVITKNFLKYIPRKEKAGKPIVFTLFRETFDRDCEIVGEKHPFYWKMNLKFIESHVDTLKIIHIVRRPDDVVRSYLHRARLTAEGLDQWKFNDPYEGFEHWIEAWGQMRRRRRSLPGDKFLAVKYEDFILSDEPYFKIQEFLGVPDAQFLRLVQGVRSEQARDVSGEIEEHANYVFSDIIEKWGEPVENLSEEFAEDVFLRRLRKTRGKSRPSDKIFEKMKTKISRRFARLHG